MCEIHIRLLKLVKYLLNLGKFAMAHRITLLIAKYMTISMAEFYLARYNNINCHTKYFKFKFFKITWISHLRRKSFTRNIVFTTYKQKEVIEVGEIPDVPPEVVTPFLESPSLPTKDVSGLGDITNVPPEAVTPFRSHRRCNTPASHILRRDILPMQIKF